MRELLLLMAVSIILSCNRDKTRDDLSQTSIIQTEIDDAAAGTEVNNAQSGTVIDSSNVDVENDCIFDQATQTDEFLKNIPEFEGYVWDNESKTATVVLNDKDTLLVGRGGCYDFGVSAEFIIHSDSIDFSNWNNVFSKVLWVAEILDNEFAFEKIKQGIETERIIITGEDSISFVYFENEYLQLNNYEISRIYEKDKVRIGLSYYIN